MNIVFAGDTHGTLDHFREIPSDACVIHVGDFAPLPDALDRALPAELAERFFWVPGNHDFDKPQFYEQAFTDYGRSRCIDLKVIQLGGLRIAGMGRIFSRKIWWPKRELANGETTRAARLSATPRQERFDGGLSLRQRKYIFREDFDRLATNGANVLVTHEALTSHRHGFAGIDALAEALGVHTIVHGHHHEAYVAQLASGVRVIGVGLRALTSLDGSVLKRGERSTQSRP